MFAKLRKFLNDHVATSLVLVFTMFGFAVANLTSHLESTLDSLFLELDTDHDGSFIDEDWYLEIFTALGITARDTDFGEFSGSTITDNEDLKDILQELEASVETKQPTVSDGLLADGVVMKDDLHEEVKWLREAITTDADPYTVTPTGDWDDYRTYELIVTTHAADVDIKLSETGPPANGCEARLYITSGNDALFPDTDAQMEVIPDGSTKTVAVGEWITFKYDTDRWVQKDANANEQFSTFTTVETEVIPVGYMIDGASAPDALATLTSGTDKVDARTFAGDADEDLLFEWEVPADLDTSTGIKFRVICFVSSATGPSAETWQFELQGFSLGDGDALDGTLGTAQTSNSGSRTDAQYDRVSTAWSGALEGTTPHITDLAVGETVIFKLYRDVDDTDDYVQNVAVSAIELKYKRDHDISF